MNALHQRGFSLIELVVTFTLLAILTMLAAPAFATWIANTRVRTVADALQTGVRLAQAEAVRRNQDLALSFTNDVNPLLNPTVVAGGRSWSIQTIPSPLINIENGSVSEHVRSGVFADVGLGVTISGVETGTATPVLALCFNANGRILPPTAPVGPSANCAARSVTFTVSQASSDRPLAVTVALGGQVRMCDPNRPTLSAASPDGCP